MRRTTIARRLAARLLTGPAGHFAAGVVDWVVLLGRLSSARGGRTGARPTGGERVERPPVGHP